MRGTVGNRACVFALEVLGHNVWAVPTITLPWHPGHGPATRIVAEADEFAGLLDDLTNAPWLSEVGAVLSGYLAHPSQAAAIARFIGKIKSTNPDIVYVCDPVIGDAGGLYVSNEIAASIRDNLVPLADLITPNRFELAWLCRQQDFETNSDILSAVTQLGRPKNLVTSAFSMLRGATGNLLIESGKTVMAEHFFVADPPNGVGDLTAALFLAHMLQGLPLEKALEKTTSSVFEVLQRAAGRGGEELMLEKDALSLSRPMALVQMRNLPVPP